MAADRLKEQKWVITGKNRLTGQRDIISSPHGKCVAMEMLARKKRRQNCHSVYSLLKITPAEQEGWLPL